jgi:hypothetical protein
MMSEMQKRFWMMNSHYEFVEISENEYKAEATDIGEDLINNRIEATIYRDSILWFVEVDNVHGSDIAAINKIVADVEAEVGHA